MCQSTIGFRCYGQWTVLWVSPFVTFFCGMEVIPTVLGTGMVALGGDFYVLHHAEGSRSRRGLLELKV